MVPEQGGPKPAPKKGEKKVYTVSIMRSKEAGGGHDLRRTVEKP